MYSYIQEKHLSILRFLKKLVNLCFWIYPLVKDFLD